MTTLRRTMDWMVAAGLGAILTAAGLWAWAAIDNSESWGTLPYEGHLQFNDGPANGPHDFCFRLYDGTSPIWAEAQAGVEVTAGTFNVRLGAVTVLNSAVEDAADLSLEINVTDAATVGPRDCTTGDVSNDYAPLTPRQRLGSAAYAISAKQGVPGQDFLVDGTIRAADGFGYVPVGTILAWHRDFTGTALTLPPGWVECNGQEVTDLDSPFNGLTLPQLNGDARFLRGGAVSGTIQADSITNHQHNYTRAANCNERWNGGNSSYECSPTTLQTTATAITASGAQTTIESETRPVNMSVVWVMRIK
jgi:hypothetical protein